MSIILSVEFSDEKRQRSLQSDAELDPDLVAHRLRSLFPDLKLPNAAQPETEITSYPGWFQVRLTLYAGRRGVRSVYTEVWHTRRWYEGIDEHRSQLATLLVSPLLELAHAGGARLLVDDPGIDMTDAEPADIAEYFIRPPTERGWSPPAAASNGTAMDDDVYLEQFLEAAGPRLQWLREQSAQTGGPAPEQLDFNRDSLVPLWAWAAPRFHRLRPGEQPTPRPKPVWIGRLGRTPQPGWTNESLELMDSILYYIGETLIRAVSGAHWAIYRSPDGRPTYHSGQAVIMGFGPAMDLEAYVSELASKTMFTPTDASVLQKEFDLMMSWATPSP